ncbi:unnamed protein product [Ilex paraguariensis]|uniref:Disease resistance R13L4/SHOC-2-like LRR domain-containing protein n=1 Tax=Ilex paraguariensis TaxID=185542 RepID=A0ABC8QXD8_9AQUA
MFRYSPHGTEVFEYYFGIRTPPNIYKLKNLQVLSCVEAESDLMRRIRSMTQLPRFSITKVREADEKDLCTAIQSMNLLRWLNVMVKDEAETLRMDVLTAAPPHLKSLLLAGKLEKVPHWFQSLRSLVYLRLYWSRLTQDVFPFIQALPCLGILVLDNAYSEKKSYCLMLGSKS